MYFFNFLIQGLWSFLLDTSFYSISMERIINESEETKKSIQKSIDRELQSGRIKPFDRYLLTGGCTGVQALEALEWDILFQVLNWYKCIMFYYLFNEIV